MAYKKTKGLLSVVCMVVLMASLAGAGSFAISVERRQKAEIARVINDHEREIEKLRRENEELSFRIAEQENPSKLNKRSGARLVSPKTKGSVVLAYRGFDAGSVKISGNQKQMVSFKMPKIAEDGKARQ